MTLPPRLRQTLRGLASGLSEKEIAAELGLSAHTVHGYVKSLYRCFDVSSRSELLASCLGADDTPRAALIHGLPPRLRETLQGLVLGLGEEEIAADLGSSPHTVREYIKSLYRRLNVSSRAELLAFCFAPRQGSAGEESAAEKPSRPT